MPAAFKQNPTHGTDFSLQRPPYAAQIHSGKRLVRDQL